MSIESLFKPGSIVYTNGRGISIITGRKTISISGLPDQVTWEMRSLSNILATTSIPESKIAKSNVRGFSQRQDLELAFAVLTDRKVSTRQNLRQYIDQTEQLILSSNLNDIALAIACLIHTNKVKRSDLKGITIKKAEQIKKAVTLLAEDLSMASGLSIPAARDHIFSLALSTDKIDIWPVQSIEPKPTELDSDIFEKAFGITIDDAYDLNQNSLKITPFSEAGKDSTISHINTFLNQSMASKVSNPVKFFLSANPDRQEQFQEVIQLANLRGIGRESIEFAFLRLEETQFYALAMRYLVRPENRLSMNDISQRLNVERDELENLIQNSINRFTELAPVHSKYEFVEYLSQQISDTKPAQQKPIPTSPTANSGAYKRLSFFVPDRGPKKGAFDLAATILEDDSLYILTFSHLAKKEHVQSSEELAGTYNTSIEDINNKRNIAIKILAEKAAELGYKGYITYDMIANCPEAGEITGKAISEKTVSVRAAKQQKETPEIFIDEGIQKLSVEENQYIPSRGFLAILYKLAQQSLSAVQFSVYVAGDIRIKDYKLSIDQLSEKLGLSRDEVISIRNEAIGIMKQAILDNNIEMPGFNVKALGQTVERTKRPYNRKQKPSSDSETLPNNNQSEDDILSEMRVYGFNENSLYKLGVIYENRGDIKTATLLYGAASDLSEHKNSTFVEALRNAEIQLGQQYNTNIDFPALEIFIQEKLNEGLVDEIDLQADFTDSALDDDGSIVVESEAIEAEFVELEPESDRSRPNSRNEQARMQPHITYSLPPEIFAQGNRLKMCFNNTGQGTFEVTLEVENGQPQQVSNDSSGSGTGLEVTFTQNAQGKPIIQVWSPKKIPEDGTNPAPI